MSTLTLEQSVAETGATVPARQTGDATERTEETHPYSMTLSCTFEARNGEEPHPRAPANTRSQVR